MTDEELTTAVRAAHGALIRAVDAAMDAGLTVDALFVDRLPSTGRWALGISISRRMTLGETDGQHWVQRERPGLHGETGGATHGATGA